MPSNHFRHDGMKAAQASACAAFAFGCLLLVALPSGRALAAQPADPWAPAPAAPSSSRALPGAAATAAVPAQAAPADDNGSDASTAMFEQLQSMRSLIEGLTGRIEELENAQHQAREEQKARYLDLDARINALGQPAAGAAAAAGAPAASTPAAATPGGNAERDEYEAAKQLVLDSRYTEAIKAFERYLKNYPRGEYMAHALYWLGEMWLVVDKPDPALAQRYFARVPNEFPRSDKASAATYKIGLLQCQGGDKAKGRVTLSRLKVQYGSSPEARLVDDALAQYCK